MTHRFVLIVCSAVIVAAFFVFKTYEHFYETIPDLYAQAWVAGMVITHMKLHEGHWPHDWDDLTEDYEINCQGAGRPWSLEDLRNRVNIDFSAKPEELAKISLNNGNVPFRVIALRNGKRHHWQGSEPNLMIWRYLQERAQASEARVAAARWR